MGWKAVKDHYRIEHTVHMRDGCLAIGSPYISEIIKIKPDGTFVKLYGDGSNADLLRYQSEIHADIPAFVTLMAQPDVFAESFDAWTYDAESGELTLHKCERRGWPNCTHSGELMYENTFFSTAEGAAKAALSNLSAGVRQMERRITELSRDAQEAKDAHMRYSVGHTRLLSEFPHLSKGSDE